MESKKGEIHVVATVALPTFRCLEEDCKLEFAVVTVLDGGVDKDDNPYDPQVFFWGNPDRPPFCPHCGKKNVTRNVS